MTSAIDEAEAERHRATMAKRKAVQDAEVPGKTIEKGLLIVHTPQGKSTAAFGLARHARPRPSGGRGNSSRAPGRPASDAFAALGSGVLAHHGEGFTWETQDIKRDIAAPSELRARHSS